MNSAVGMYVKLTTFLILALRLFMDLGGDSIETWIHSKSHAFWLKGFPSPSRYFAILKSRLSKVNSFAFLVRNEVAILATAQ